MNWLAHVFLARDDDGLMAGGFAADFLRGEGTGVHERLRPGVELHRAIDTFTDAHPLFRGSKARLRKGLRFARGVVVDMLYDHLLARDFERFHHEPLPAFAARVYQALAHHEAHLPSELRRLWPRIAKEDWLSSYADPDQVRIALERMAGRMRRPLPLAEGLADFLADPDGFSSDFGGFFPALQDQVARLRPLT